MMKITTKRQIETRLPEQKPHRITNAHCYSVRPNIAKPHVQATPAAGCLAKTSLIHKAPLLFLIKIDKNEKE